MFVGTKRKEVRMNRGRKAREVFKYRRYIEGRKQQGT
jgi:hypothetical protein